MPEAERMIGEIITEYKGHKDEVVQMALLPYSDITIPDFQRGRKLQLIDKIAAEFDATAFAFPFVAEWRKYFLALDGQQRLAAWEKRPINGGDLVSVLLITGIASKERLSQLYLHINRDRKLLNAFEKYVGALDSKDKGTVDIAKLVVDEYGLEVAHKATADGHVPAGTIMRIHEMGGNDLLNRVLFIQQAAWGDQKTQEANEATTLRGLALFLRRYYDRVDDDRLIAKLEKRHPGYILGAIDPKITRNRMSGYADWLKADYNRGLKGRERL